MFDFTTNQWAVIGLVFILGMLIGLYMLAGGRKWRPAFEAERAARIAAEEQNQALITRIDAANARIAELERTRVPIDGTAAGSIAAASGRHDDLARIFGVGRAGEIKLNELGYHRYTEISGLSAGEEATLEGRLGIAPGTITDERWREQAEMLRKGDYEDHARIFA